MDKDYPNHTGDATLLRKVNESAILELIREKGPISRSDLARLLRLSPPTITRIVNPLIEAGLVIEGSAGDSKGGRRPIMLTFNSQASLIVGIYVGQNIVGALVDLNGEIFERRTLPSLPGEEGVRRLIEFIKELCQAAAPFGAPLRGVGVGIPSITVLEDGIITWAPSFGWRNLPLKQRLQEALELPVFIENSVNLIALGESWRGAGQGLRNLLCLQLGDGIGAGLILNGQLYRGSHYAAGEVGYIIPNERYLGQTYDNYGCLEGLAGSSGIVQRAWQRLQTGQPSILAQTELNSLTVEQVLAAASAGDTLAQTVVQETVDYLSIAVANMACIIDPDRIIIGGDLAEFGELFIEPIRTRLAGLIPVTPDIRLSDLGLDAAVLGAVATALSQTSDWLFVQRQRIIS
ncbi:MAG: ROK family protein [Anaerolineae bacterium]|nr:ROK family protein [Anaerolineae bacterium]